MLPSLVQPAVVAGVVALSAAMAEVVHRVRLFAAARTPVVFVGETGTGKSFLASSIHEHSGRVGQLVDVTAGELRPELARAYIFGHERGAFTGAVGRRPGLLEQAQNGTFLLDDFHLLDVDVQGALLRAVDARRYRALGAQRDVPLNCGLLFGVSGDLDTLVTQGKVLPDLRYRLGYCVIHLPRLEERREEIAPLARLFLAQCPDESGVPDGPAEFAADVLPLLESAVYPGNLRELKGRIRAAYLLARGDPEIRVEHFDGLRPDRRSFPRWGERAERIRAVQWALTRTAGRVGAAARLLGVSRNTVSALRGAIQNSA
ncbi:MAG TPA: sigma 54-interacting transcriptional regulator [Gemmatimonadales bacterium]|nr:sigma 54-interacting transcriptional regulator [Gemmatimonadales bacterium]